MVTAHPVDHPRNNDKIRRMKTDLDKLYLRLQDPTARVHLLKNGLLFGFCIQPPSWPEGYFSQEHFLPWNDDHGCKFAPFSLR